MGPLGTRTPGSSRTRGRLEQASEKRDHRGVDAQDSHAEVDRPNTGRREGLQFKGFPSALRSDEKKPRSVHRTGARVDGSLLGDQGGGVLESRGQKILRKRTEGLVESDFRQAGIHGLLEPEAQLLSNGFGAEAATLPVAAVGSRGRHEVDLLDAEHRGVEENPP